MKVGDAVKITKPKLYQQDLADEIGIVVKHFASKSPGGKSICRVFWSCGKLDKTWRMCKELEVVSESR